MSRARVRRNKTLDKQNASYEPVLRAPEAPGFARSQASRGPEAGAEASLGQRSGSRLE
jgi:hypothetical protein